MIRVRVVDAYEASDLEPLQVAVGETVEIDRRDTEWPEFVFLTAPGGAGWVPARYLSQASGRAVVQTPYDTTELPAGAGDVLVVVEEDRRSGWLWCRAADGREGWIPVRNVEDIRETS